VLNARNKRNHYGTLEKQRRIPIEPLWKKNETLVEHVWNTGWWTLVLVLVLVVASGWVGRAFARLIDRSVVG